MHAARPLGLREGLPLNSEIALKIEPLAPSKVDDIRTQIIVNL